MISITPLAAQEYFAEITEKISSAVKGDRVALTSMTFDPQESGMAALMGALRDAAEHGAQVTLLIDAHSFMFQTGGWPNGPSLWPIQLNQHTARYYQRKLRVIESLQKAGCTVQIINEPHGLHNPYGGRSHIKLTVINNLSYLGGCNLSGDDTADMMLRLDDKSTTAYLYDQVAAIAKTKRTRDALQADQSHSVDEQTTLYIDQGKPGQSLIYARALQLIDDAQEYIVMTCQYFPDRLTMQHLERAIKRGVKVELYFNHPLHTKQEQPLKPIHWLRLRHARLRYPTILFKHMLPRSCPYLHLKLIATEQGAILGSHNYVEVGVRFGTAEIALIRMNQGFSQELIKKVQLLLN